MQGFVPEHVGEAPQLRLSFIVAAGLLPAAVAAHAVRPNDRRAA